jgi:hypothetical protein
MVLPAGIAPVVAATGWLLLTFLVPDARAEIYRNREFGIEVAIPQELRSCRGGQNEHDHGTTIFLDQNGSQDCGDPVGHRAISIFAFDNALDDTGTLRNLLRWACRDVLKGHRDATPGDLWFGPYSSVSSLTCQADGWVDVVVATRGPVRLPDFPTGMVNYIVTLYTNPTHFVHDLRSFRNFLHRIRLLTPE